MPVFDWDGNGSPVVKDGFKHYWTITAPLTSVVFMIWGAATVLTWTSWLAKRRGKQTTVTGDQELVDLEEG